MKQFILQETSSDCGFACLKIMLCKYKRNQKYLYLKEEKVSRLSFLDIKKISMKNDLILEGVYFEDIEELYNHKFSIIQIVQNKKSHFVIFLSKHHKNIKIFDPSVGLRMITIDEFKKIFTGYSLISKNKSKKSLFKYVHIIPNSYKLTYIFSLFIDFGFVYLLSYLLKNDFENIKIILLILGVIVNIVLKFIIINSFHSYFDNKYMSEINNFNYKKINSVMSLKNEITKYHFNKLNNYFILFTLIIILLSNGFHYLYLLINVILCLLFRWVYIENKLLLIKEKLYYFNEKLMIKEDKKLSYNNLKKLSLFYVLLDVLPTILLFIINFIVLIITNHIFSYSSSTYIIFSLFTLFTIFQIISNMIKKSRTQSLEIKTNKSKYLSIMINNC